VVSRLQGSLKLDGMTRQLKRTLRSRLNNLCVLLLPERGLSWRRQENPGGYGLRRHLFVCHCFERSPARRGQLNATVKDPGFKPTLTGITIEDHASTVQPLYCHQALSEAGKV
jgi:hypothetical protein